MIHPHDVAGPVVVDQLPEVRCGNADYSAGRHDSSGMTEEPNRVFARDMLDEMLGIDEPYISRFERKRLPEVPYERPFAANVDVGPAVEEARTASQVELVIAFEPAGRAEAPEPGMRCAGAFHAPLL